MGLALDESKGTKDNLIEVNAIKVLYNKEIKYYLESGLPLKVDYLTSENGSGFYLDSGSCAC